MTTTDRATTDRTTKDRSAVAPGRHRPHAPLTHSRQRRGGVDLVHKGRPLHRGRSLEQATVDCAVYADGRRQGARLELKEAIAAARLHDDGFVWIGLYQPDALCLQQVADEFGLHPLAVEDAVLAHQRPKLETFDDSLFMVLKTVRYVDHDSMIETGELMLFVGDGFVVTVRHGEASDLGNVRAELETRPDLLELGPVAVLYGVVDRVVDGYLPAADAIERDVDEIEEQVFSTARDQPTARIYKLKRELVEFRRAVEPLLMATQALADGHVPGLRPQSAQWFRDIHDHVVRSSEHVNTMDDLLNTALSANVAQVSLMQNNDMRKISAWVAIFAASTLIAGIYGMNFDHMPELGWALGYPMALSLMVGISLALYRAFRRNDWL